MTGRADHHERICPVFAKILSFGVKLETIQVTFVAGAVFGMTAEAVLITLANAGLDLAHFLEVVARVYS
jgi:hypothetical protein